MYSILPASASPPLLSSEPKPRLPRWGTPRTPPTAYCCHPSPLKGPGNTQLSFRQLLPSLPSEEERGLREGGEGSIPHELLRNTYICTHILHLYTPPPPHTPHPHTFTPPLSRSLTVRSTSTPFRCKKSVFMYIFVFGLVFSASYLSEGRYNPSFESRVFIEN